MRRLNGLITLSLAFALAFAAPALAKQEQMSKDNTGMIQAAKQDFFRFSNFIDKDVKSQSGNDLGTVEDVVVDPNGTFHYVIISPADATGNRLVPIPWQAIRKAPNGDFLIANIDRNRIDNAPSFNRNNWPDLHQPRWEQNVSSYYGIGPYAQENSQQRTYQQSEREGARQQWFGSSNRGTEGAAIVRETYVVPKHTMREYLGKAIWNDRGEQVGTIDNFVFDPDSGRISYAIVGIGEGDKETAVPWSAFDTSKGNVYLHVNKDKFASAPSFPRDRYPNFTDEDWNNRVRAYYGETQFREGASRGRSGQ